MTCQDEDPFSGVSWWDIIEVEEFLLFQISNPSSSTNSLPFRLIFSTRPNVLKRADLNGAGGRASVSSTTRKVLQWAPSISYTYHVLGKTSIEKKRFLSGIARIMGGGLPMPKFLALFLEVHFWSIKRVYFFKNANVLNFNCFLGCIYTVYHIVYIVFLVLN